MCGACNTVMLCNYHAACCLIGKRSAWPVACVVRGAGFSAARYARLFRATGGLSSRVFNANCDGAGYACTHPRPSRAPLPPLVGSGHEWVPLKPSTAEAEPSVLGSQLVSQTSTITSHVHHLVIVLSVHHALLLVPPLPLSFDLHLSLLSFQSRFIPTSKASETLLVIAGNGPFPWDFLRE
jgi:hypothetical protein